MSTKKKSSTTAAAAAATATTATASAATPKAGASTTKKQARRGRVLCGVCQSPIVDGKDETLLCEGECGYWLHRGCASVSPTLYKELSTSPDPFTCLSCTNIQLKREIQLLRTELSNMTTVRDKLAALEIEVAALRETMSTSRQPPSVPHPSNTKRTYARAARTRSAARPATSPARTAVLRTAAKSPTTQQQQRATNSAQSGPSRQERVPVEGVRRVWGTLKATSTTAVTSTLKKLTTLGDRLTIRKKVKTDANRWWFLIKGDEQLLCELEGEWDRVSLQTNWKLESCTKPSDTVPQPPTATATDASTSTSASPISTSHEGTTTAADTVSNTSSSPTTMGTDSSTPTDDHSFQVDHNPHQVT